jgi:hypothetical protein
MLESEAVFVMRRAISAYFNIHHNLVEMVKLKYDTVPLLNSNQEENRRLSEDSISEGDDKSNNNQNGIGWTTAAVFIVADIAGGGVVTIPSAILKSGGYLSGIIVTSIVCAIFTYTGILLGDIWIDMCRRWPVYRKEMCRKPYPGKLAI